MSGRQAVCPEGEFAGHVVDGLLGRGRHGEVYRARKGARVVALRLLAPGGRPVPSVLEALGAGGGNALRHPNLAPVFESGESGGRLWYTTSYLRGDSLRLLLDDLAGGHSDRPSLCPLAVGPGGEIHPDLPFHAARLIAEVAEGLEEAHARDLHHLDLRPESLIFSPAGRLVVTDFGLRDESPGPAVLPYRAPEQLIGPRDVGGARSDVYALGAILYEIVTRRPPFEGRGQAFEGRGQAATELRRAVVRGKHVPPRAVRPDVPRALEECIEHALAPRPQDRYSSAASFAADLRRFLRGELPRARRLRSLKERLLTRDEASFSFPVRVAVAAILTCLLSIAFFGTQRLRVYSRIESAAVAALDSLQEHDVAGALDGTGRLRSSNPGNSTLRALHGLVARTAASEEAARHLLEALDDLGPGVAATTARAEEALSEIERAGELLSGEPTLEAVVTRLRRQLHRDPTETLLGDPRQRVRLAGLDLLADAIASGRRDEGVVDQVAARLGDDQPAVRARALEVLASFDSGPLVIERIGLGTRPVRLDAEGFLALHHALRTIADAASRDVLSRWCFEAMEAADLAPAGSTLELEPDVAVRIEAGSPRRFTRSWLRSASLVAPETLLALAPALADREGLAPEVVGALAAVEGDPRAAERIVEVARRHWAEAGLEAVRALGRRGDDEALASLARGCLPVPYRAAALRELVNLSGDRSAPVLASLFLQEPEPRLREAALERLSGLAPDAVADPAPVLLRALGERHLRGRALEWFARLESERRGEIALALLDHDDPVVRARARRALREDHSARRLLRLLPLLFARRASTRIAALGVVEDRVVPRDLALSLRRRLGAAGARAVSSLRDRALRITRAVARSSRRLGEDLAALARRWKSRLEAHSEPPERKEPERVEARSAVSSGP